MRPQKRILLFGALKLERSALQALLHRMDSLSTLEPVIVSIPVGCRSSSKITTLINKYQPVAAGISFGLAGAVIPSQQVSDIVIPSAIRILSSNELVSCSPWLIEHCRSLPNSITKPTILFPIESAQSNRLYRYPDKCALAHDYPHTASVDMESGVVLKGLSDLGVPGVVIRVISDTVTAVFPADRILGALDSGPGAVLRAIQIRDFFQELKLFMHLRAGCHKAAVANAETIGLLLQRLDTTEWY